MLVIKDFATTILASALTAAATSVVVSDASRLPALSVGDYYYLVLQKFTDRTSVEVVKVTGVSGNTLTVVRAQAGTTAKSFAIGDYAEQRVTVGTFSEYIAQSVAGKVDKSDGYVEQSLGLLNTGDLVKATVGVSYDAANGHGTILSGGEGANKVTPYVALRPLGVADSSVQLKYAQDGSLILSGGSRYVETGLLSMKHPYDANGWPNAVNSDANNYNSRARGKVHVNNNALYFIADAALNARRFGIQSGHEHPAYATSYGILDLNPFGGIVRVNGGIVYHTNYAPTPAAVGALALVGGTLTGSLGVRPSVGVNPLDLFSTPNPAGTSAQGVAGWDNTGATREWGVGRYATAGVAEYAYFGFGDAPWNSGLRVYGAGDIRAGAVNRLYHEGYLPTPDALGAVPQARTINSKPLTSNITLSAADVGALALSGGTVSGALGVTAILDLVGPSASDMADIVWKAPDGTERGRLWIGGTIGADNSLTWRSGASGATHKIYHEGNKPTAADVGAVPQALTINSKPLTANIVLNHADVGAAPSGYGLGEYAASVPGNNLNTGLRTASGFYNASLADNRPAWPMAGAHTWDFVFNAAHSNAAGYNGMIAIDFNGKGLAFKAIAAGADMGWNYVYHSGYLPSPATIGAVAASDDSYWRNRGGTTNLNDAALARPGYFRFVPGATGIPLAGIYGHGFSIGPGSTAGSGVWYSQIVFGHNNRIYTRNGVNGAATGAWNYFFTSNDRPTPTDIGLSVLSQNTNGLRISLNGKYLDIGARNTSWTHFQTDATSGVYFYNNIAAADVQITSDERLKSEFEPIVGALDKVRSLSGLTYTKRAVEGDATKREAGLIAQAVQRVLPEAVGVGADDFLTLSPTGVIALLVEAIKELEVKLDDRTR